MRLFSSQRNVGKFSFPNLFDQSECARLHVVVCYKCLAVCELNLLLNELLILNQKLTAMYLYMYLSDFLSALSIQAGCESTFNRSTIYIALLPEGAPWQCRLACEHDCCYYRRIQERNPFGQSVVLSIVVPTLTAFKVLDFGC